MKILRDYRVAGALYVNDTGVEAQVSDQVTLYLDRDAESSFPISIVATIQHPITKIECGSVTSYALEYNELHITGARLLLRPHDIIDATVVSGVLVVATQLGVETAARIAADVAHEADTTAHPASAVSFNPVGSIAATNVQAAIAELGSEKVSTVNLVWEGDSILAAYNIPALTEKLLSYTTPETTNYAVSGQTVANMVGQYATEGRTKSPAVTGRPGIFFIAGGTNDFGGGATATAVYNNLKSIWAAALADGYKVVACTVHRNLDPNANVSNPRRSELNALIKSDQTLYTYLVDIDHVLERGTPTYYLDQVHPTARGAKAIAAAIAKVLAGGIPNSAGLVLAELNPRIVTDTDYVVALLPSFAFGSIYYEPVGGFLKIDQDGCYEFTGYAMGVGSGVTASHWFLFGVEVLDAATLTTNLRKGDYKTGLNVGSQAIGFNFSIALKLKKDDQVRVALLTTAPSFSIFGGSDNSRFVAKQIENPEIAPY